MNTNIKNIPEGRMYFTEYGYSDAKVWVEVSRSETGKTVHLAPVEVSVDPEWKEKMQADIGGFCAHVSNQNEQTWIFKRIVDGSTKTVRKTKKGWSSKGVQFVEDKARHFHDYNF